MPAMLNSESIKYGDAFSGGSAKEEAKGVQEETEKREPSSSLKRQIANSKFEQHMEKVEIPEDHYVWIDHETKVTEQSILGFPSIRISIP